METFSLQIVVSAATPSANPNVSASIAKPSKSLLESSSQLGTQVTLFVSPSKLPTPEEPILSSTLDSHVINEQILDGDLLTKKETPSNILAMSDVDT